MIPANKTSILIREMVREDLIGLRRDMPVPGSVFPPEVVVELQGDHALSCVVATEENRFVGRGLILWEGYVVEPLKSAYPGIPVIREISVVTEERRRGIGTEIVLFLERLARKSGHRTVSLGVEEENIGAARLWRRMGYVSWPHDAVTVESHYYQGKFLPLKVREETFIPMFKALTGGLSG